MFDFFFRLIFFFKYIDVEEISLIIYMDIDNVRDQLKRSLALTTRTHTDTHCDSFSRWIFWKIIVVLNWEGVEKHKIKEGTDKTMRRIHVDLWYFNF